VFESIHLDFYVLVDFCFLAVCLSPCFN